jgi:hypothetical protein
MSFPPVKVVTRLNMVTSRLHVSLVSATFAGSPAGHNRDCPPCVTVATPATPGL